MTNTDPIRSTRDQIKQILTDLANQHGHQVTQLNIGWSLDEHGISATQISMGVQDCADVSDDPEIS